MGQKGDGSEVGDREKKYREKGEKELRKKEHPESAEAVSLWRPPS